MSLALQSRPLPYHARFQSRQTEEDHPSAQYAEPTPPRLPAECEQTVSAANTIKYIHGVEQ